MKQYPRLEYYKTAIDETSGYLGKFCYDIDYFTHWPEQNQKKLRNIVSSRIKFILQKSGESCLITQNTHFSIGADSLVVVPPYTVYSAETYNEVDSFEIFFNVCPITREQEALHYFGIDRMLFFPNVLTGTDFELLQNCFDALQQKEPGGYMQLQAMLSLLLIRICRAQGVKPPVSMVSDHEQAVVERFLTYLAAHISRPIQIADACRDLQLSQSYLYRCCKSVMNCSPSRLITRHKMLRAQTLLKNPELTISEVAESIGYDLYYFSNQFKKLFLLSPSEYRKSRK